jgi:hypothetical protein
MGREIKAFSGPTPSIGPCNETTGTLIVKMGIDY